MKYIPMVDLQSQYRGLKSEIDEALQHVLNSSRFIGGPEVKTFEQSLASYLGISNVIACGNGTDALQIALMSLSLSPGDEVIVPAFTYVAAAEVIALLGLSPIMVDVDPHTFNVTPQIIEAAITERTKAIIPVHLFGQSCDIEGIVTLADRHKLFVIEDNAQSIGSNVLLSNGEKVKSGTLGHISTNSFFPTKNLGCYGDGGAICTSDDTLAERIRMIANHGQRTKYQHDIIGCNSRLDTLQAAVLQVKLKYLDEFCEAKYESAAYYTNAFSSLSSLNTPIISPHNSHVFHQYTLRVMDDSRDALQKHLHNNGIASAIYYPLPLYKQKAFSTNQKDIYLEHTEQLCRSVLSLPMHTALKTDTQDMIIKAIHDFYCM